MNEENMVESLRDVSFLRGIAEEHLEKLAELGKFVDFPAGAIIFREGEPAVRIFLVVSGKVSLEICDPAAGCSQVVVVGEGELLGCSPLIKQTQLTATARTLTETRAIEMNGGQILTLCEQDPSFGYEFMHRTALTLAQRLSVTRIQLLKLFETQMPTASEQE